jgi:DnaJ-class molecular chaperone
MGARVNGVLVCAPGCDNGSRLRVRSEGNSGKKGGETGDLYVYLAVKEHPEMRREGTTIHTDVDISYLDAILGANVKVSMVASITHHWMVCILVPSLPYRERGTLCAHIQCVVWSL